MDVETPSGGRDRTEMDQSLCTREEEDVPPEDVPAEAELDLGGLCPLHWNVDPGRPRIHDDHDVIQPCGCLGRHIWQCWHMW
jgi:hypothetical protein